MKTIKCDLCQREVESVTPLRPEYQTETVKEVCSDCLNELNKILANMDIVYSKMQASWFKNIINSIFKQKREK